MDRFDIYLGYFEFEGMNEGKERPIIVYDRTDDNQVLVIDLIGIYSYRKWFNGNPEFYEILDLESAGLVRRSFAKISRVVGVDAVRLKFSKRLGHLSNEDIVGLEDALNRYY